MRTLLFLLLSLFTLPSFANPPSPTEPPHDDAAFLIDILTSDNVIEQTFGLYMIDLQLESEKTGLDPIALLKSEEEQSQANIEAVVDAQRELFAQDEPSCKAIREGLNDSLVHIETVGSYFALLAMIVTAESRFCSPSPSSDFNHWTMALNGVQKKVAAQMPEYMIQTKAQLEKHSSDRYLADTPAWIEKHVLPREQAALSSSLPSLIEE